MCSTYEQLKHINSNIQILPQHLIISDPKDSAFSERPAIRWMVHSKIAQTLESTTLWFSLTFVVNQIKFLPNFGFSPIYFCPT